ncbi:MAG: hypothetical protein FWB73_00930 [Treponema sp.]|nr:hypothetical protein [Treponema sp.]
MNIRKFVIRLFAFYKTEAGKKWKTETTEKLNNCKSDKQQNSVLRRELNKLKNDWENTDLLKGLQLASDYMQEYGETDESGNKYLDLNDLADLMSIGAELPDEQ